MSLELSADNNSVSIESHPAMYNMNEKYAKLEKGGPNPCIDPTGYKTELEIDEALFHAVLERQQRAASSNAPPNSIP